MKARNIIILVIGAVVVLGLGYLGYIRYLAPIPEPTPQPSPTPIAKKPAATVVSAEGIVLPARKANLAFEIGGRVEEILVREGEDVKEGELLIRLETKDVEHRVKLAEIAVRAAEAELARIKAGAKEEDIEAAEKGLEAAKANYEAAKAGLALAEANLAKLKAGARPEEIAVAEARYRQAETSLEQVYRGYQLIEWEPGAEVSPLGYAWRQATHRMEEAKAQLDLVKAGPTSEDLAIAMAQVEQAKAQLSAALAQVGQVKAQLDSLKAGATEEEIRIAEIGLERAKSELEMAELALEDAKLLAPFPGTIAQILIEEGEMVSPGTPVVVIGDLTHLLIETKDLSEVNIAEVKEGQKVEISVDALPDVKLRGKVVRIEPFYTIRAGDVTYAVTIEMEETDPRLRWGMTVYVDIIIGSEK
jgi:HlyD family secretion protein